MEIKEKFISARLALTCIIFLLTSKILTKPPTNPLKFLHEISKFIQNLQKKKSSKLKLNIVSIFSVNPKFVYSCLNDQRYCAMYSSLNTVSFANEELASYRRVSQCQKCQFCKLHLNKRRENIIENYIKVLIV